jgi:flagellar assembly factor FliW
MDNTTEVREGASREGAPEDEAIRVESERLGALDVSPDDVLDMVSPIVGFPRTRRYCIVPTSPGTVTPFRWLQSMDQPELAFIAVDPFPFFPDYDFELPRPDQEELRVEAPDDVLVLTLVTVPRDAPHDVSQNLAAPVVVNRRTRAARQVVLYESGYTTKHYLLPEEQRAEAARRSRLRLVDAATGAEPEEPAASGSPAPDSAGSDETEG